MRRGRWWWRRRSWKEDDRGEGNRTGREDDEGWGGGDGGGEKTGEKVRPFMLPSPELVAVAGGEPERSQTETSSMREHTIFVFFFMFVL